MALVLLLFIFWKENEKKTRNENYHSPAFVDFHHNPMVIPPARLKKTMIISLFLYPPGT